VWGDWWDELGWKIASRKGYWIDNPYFQNGPKFFAWRSPGFPLFLAIIYKIFDHNFLAAKIGLAILSSITVILLFYLAEILIDKKTGLLASFVYSIYPTSIFWTGYLVPTTLEILLMIGFVLFFYIGENKKSYKNFIISGIFLGFGIITRSLFIIFIPFLFAYFLIKERRTFLKNFISVVIPSFLVVLPWGIRNYKIFNKVVISSTEGGIVCYIANNPNSLKEPTGYWNPPQQFFEKFKGMNEVEINKALYKESLNFIISNPKIYLKLVFDRFIRFWRLFPHTFSGPGESYKKYHQIISLLFSAPLIVFGLLGFLKHVKKWKNYLFIYFVIIGWSLPIILFFKTVIRYREPLTPFFIIFGIMFFRKNVEK
jgi:4-amino-4-deoxy-L-arabinose transferase-like glycosyltransferase